MWRNCLLRSGLEEPSWVLRFPCKLYFCARSSFPTVVEPTMCPFSQSSLARVRVLLHVQRIPRIGSPRTVGSIRASRSERSVGSFFVTHFRPPPGFRTRPPARGCSSKCCLPRVIRGAGRRCPPPPPPRAGGFLTVGCGALFFSPPRPPPPRVPPPPPRGGGSLPVCLGPR